MTAARLKLLLVLAIAAFGGISLLAWTQPWFSLELDSGLAIDVFGQDAAQALSALGLASLALAGALSISGRSLRYVLGAVQLAIGAIVVVTAIRVLSDPLGASATPVSEATGVSGSESIAAIVVSVTATAWPVLTIAIGAIAGILGVLVIVTARRWPGPTRKYETGPSDAQTPAGTWDALSEGTDPTAR